MSHPLNIQSCIIKHSIGAAAVGVPGAFAAHADVPVLVGIWGKMIYNIAQHAKKDISSDTAAKIAVSIGMTAGTFAATGKVANTYFAVSGVGTPLAILFNSSLNGVSTYAIGDSVANVILKDELSSGDIVKAAIGGLSAAFGNFFTPGNPKP